MAKKPNYTTHYKALGGWQSVLVDGETGEPIITGMGPFATEQEAKNDAVSFAAAEGVECK